MIIPWCDVIQERALLLRYVICTGQQYPLLTSFCKAIVLVTYSTYIYVLCSTGDQYSYVRNYNEKYPNVNYSKAIPLCT